jgi:hypothetical protein
MKNVKAFFTTVVIALILIPFVVYADTWYPDKRFTNNAGSSHFPAIAVNGSNVYLVWSDNTPGNEEIYFKRSVDGGLTWTANKRLTNNADTTLFLYPAIAVNGSKIYLVWNDNTPGNPEIYFKRSVDGGLTWTANKRLTNNAGNSYAPAIAVDGSNVFVVWHDGTPDNWEIYFKRSVDGGLTWTMDKRLTNNTGSSYAPAIAVDGSNVFVVWSDNTPGNEEIYFKRSVDGGLTWTVNKRLTNNGGGSYLPRNAPAIAVNGSNIFVLWYDNKPGNPEIYFKRSVDGGLTWTANKRLTNNVGSSYAPAIAVDGSKINVVWNDNTPAISEIYFKRSVDGGLTWTANKRLTNNAGGSYLPAIAVDGSNIFVVWHDDTPGNWEIYFKRGTLN